MHTLNKHVNIKICFISWHKLNITIYFFHIFSPYKWNKWKYTIKKLESEWKFSYYIFYIYTQIVIVVGTFTVLVKSAFPYFSSHAVFCNWIFFVHFVWGIFIDFSTAFHTKKMDFPCFAFYSMFISFSMKEFSFPMTSFPYIFFFTLCPDIDENFSFLNIYYILFLKFLLIFPCTHFHFHFPILILLLCWKNK